MTQKCEWKNCKNNASRYLCFKDGLVELRLCGKCYKKHMKQLKKKFGVPDEDVSKRNDPYW